MLQHFFICVRKSPLRVRGVSTVKDSTHQRALEELASKLGIKILDDWYQVSVKQVQQQTSFLKDYGNLHNALENFYPHHKWDPKRFVDIPRGFWSDLNTQRKALKLLGERLGIKSLDDWYSVDEQFVKKELRFINYYHGSLYDALKVLYPNHRWNPLKFSKAPRGYWKDINTQRDALEKFGTQIGVKQLDDWYSVDVKTVLNELSFISYYYKSSLCAALKNLYPQHDWNPLKFTRAPQRYWKDINAQRAAFERLGSSIGVKELDDWYSVDAAAVKNELCFIGDYYNSSLCAALKSVYPHHDWNPSRFTKAPQRYWKDIAAQRDALEKLALELGVKELDDWYAVDSRTVKKKLSFVTSYYSSSLYKTLVALYPQHEWNPILFSRVHKGYWQQSSTVNHYHELFNKWREQYSISQLRDWYQLPPLQVKIFQLASRGIFGSVTKMLREWFPKTNWTDEIQSSTPELELQMMLRLVTDDLKLHHRIGKHNVDIFLPECQVAIEYQGIQHYQQNWRGDYNSQRQRDEAKSAELSQQNIPIIPISYRWNGTWSQLRSTIKAARANESLQ